MANPASPPAIDWAMYQSKIAVPGLVESFKKQYEALKVPYPADKVSPQIDVQAKEAVRVYILQINYSFNWYLQCSSLQNLASSNQCFYRRVQLSYRNIRSRIESLEERHPIRAHDDGGVCRELPR